MWKEFLLDPQFDFASISMTILDDRSGDILFEHQKNVGLPPASSMKTITAAAALHHLGENFTYSTTLKYSGTIDRQTGFLDGFLYIVGQSAFLPRRGKEIFFRCVVRRKRRPVVGKRPVRRVDQGRCHHQPMGPGHRRRRHSSVSRRRRRSDRLGNDEIDPRRRLDVERHRVTRPPLPPSPSARRSPLDNITAPLIPR